MQILYYTKMHLWKDNIISKVTREIHSYSVVHCSEKSWLLGELVTSEITLATLPDRIYMYVLGLKIMMDKDRKKIKKWLKNEENNEKKEKKKKMVEKKMQVWVWKSWWFAIQFLLLVLLVLPPVVLAFIALSIGKDIKMMIDRLCYWMIGKLCNSDSAPQVS